MKNYSEDSDVGYFFEVDIEYPKHLWSSQKYLPFLPEGRLEKEEKLTCSIRDKEKCYAHKSLKTSIKPWISIKKITQSN